MVYSPDNFESLRLALEQASIIVTSATVSTHERQANEAILLDFRSSKSPYEFCRYLLHTSKSAYVLFQAVSTLREATLREWTLLPATLVPELENFLLNYVVASVQQADHVSDKYVQRQVLQTLAVFYKRSKLDACKSRSESENMVKAAISLFTTANDVKLKQVCLSLLLAMLQEFSNTSRSTNLGLSNDSHFTAKRSFEQNEFKQLLMFIYDTTQELMSSLSQNNITSIVSLDPTSRDTLIQLFALIDASFTWEFTSSKHILKNLMVSFNSNVAPTTTSTTITPPLEPTPEFKDFFLNPQLISLLFTCYQLIRDDPEMAHAAMQPLIQLSTLNGPIFNDDFTTTITSNSNLRTNFLASFIQSFLSTFSKSQLRRHESLNYACLIENILSTANVKRFQEIDCGLVEALFTLICQFVVECFKAERGSGEDKVFLESYEKVLIAWVAIKDTLEIKPQSMFEFIFKNYAVLVFDAFLESRLSSFGDGNGEKSEIVQISDEDGSDGSDDDDDDDGSDDLHRYREVLYAIGEMSRFGLEKCLPTLAKLLNDRYTHLLSTLSNLQFTSSSDSLDRLLSSLSEDIHWLCLISGFALFQVASSDHTDAQQPQIPSELMAYSIHCSQFVDQSLLDRLFATIATTKHTNEPSDRASIDLRLQDHTALDPIIRLILTTYQLASLETHMFTSNLLHLLSPQVAATLAWFFKELARSYLYLIETDHAQLSLTLVQCFGQDTQNARLSLDFLLRKVNTNFFIWSAENMVTSASARLLLEIVKRRQLAQVLLQNEQFWAISQVAVVDQMPWNLLSAMVKKLVMKALVVSCSLSESGSDKQMQVHFDRQVLGPLTNRFEALSSCQSIHSEKTIREVMGLVEAFNGIVEGCTPAMVKHLVVFVIPRLKQGVQLLDFYHNYGEIVELVLCMFNGVIERFLAHCQIVEARQEIYHCFVCLIQVFSKHNSGKRSLDANLEEDYYNDLLLFITLLNTLLSIDSDDEQSNQSTSQTTNNPPATIDIVLIGLEFLIPLMNQDLLKSPALCLQYFKLLSHTAYSNTAKLFACSQDLFNSLTTSIHFGIDSGAGTEVVRLSLECIPSLCKFAFTNQVTPQQTQCLSNLFKPVFDMLFRRAFELGLFEVSAGVVYSLISCFRCIWLELVGELVGQYEDEELRCRIAEGFRVLSGDSVSFDMQKRSRLRFSAKFNEFCVKTYGLLFVR